MKNGQANLFANDNELEDEISNESKHNFDEQRLKPKSTSNYTSSIWTFPGSGGDQLYRWYGTLPRALIEQLISLYANNPATRILDSFTGLGTTLDVAADLQLKTLGLDSNPLACLATEARLLGIPSQEIVLSSIQQILNNLIQKSNINDNLSNEWDDLLNESRFAYSKKWFKEDTLIAILRLLFKIADIKDVQIQRLCFVSAAQIVRDVASVDPRCTHHLVTKIKPFIDPLPLWHQKVLQNIKIVRSVPVDPEIISVRQSSILESKLDKNSADFVFIHPPYLGVIHYHLIHRLATDLLDIVNTIRKPKSLNKYNFDHAFIKSNDVSTDNTKPYRAFVERLAIIMESIVAPDGRCAVIIGDQRHKGHLRHPFTDFIQSFENHSFELEENFIWILQNNGGMHVLRRGHFIDHNYILIFHKRT